MTKELSRPTPDGCGCHWSYGNLTHVDWHMAWGKFADDAEALSRASPEPSAGLCPCAKCQLERQVTEQQLAGLKSSEGHRDPELARENVVAPYQDVPLMERSERAIKKPLTPNDCPKCVGLGYCRCEIASNE